MGCGCAMCRIRDADLLLFAVSSCIQQIHSGCFITCERIKMSFTLKEICFHAILSELGYPNSQKKSTVFAYKRAIENFRFEETQSKIPKVLVKQILQAAFGEDVWDDNNLSDDEY